MAESRVTKLLTARGDAFQQLLPRVVRLMASKSVAPNWAELGPLVLMDARVEARDSEDADAIRLRIASAWRQVSRRSSSTALPLTTIAMVNGSDMPAFR